MKKILLCAFALIIAVNIIATANVVASNVETTETINSSDDTYVSKACSDDGTCITVRIRDNGYTMEVVAIREQYGWRSIRIPIYSSYTEGHYFTYNWQKYYL